MEATESDATTSPEPEVKIPSMPPPPPPLMPEALFPANGILNGLKKLEVMTYNVLHPDYVRMEWYPGVDPRFMDPEVRAHKVLAEIRARLPDVLMLQEVGDLFLGLAEGLLRPLGYKYFLALRVGKQSGSAVFWRSASVDLTPGLAPVALRNLGGVELDEDGESKGVAACVCLSPVGPFGTLERTSIFFASAHLEGNPKLEDVRLRQAAELRLRAALSRANHAVIAGDFNAEPDSATIRSFVRDENLDGLYPSFGRFYRDLVREAGLASDAASPSYWTTTIAPRRIDYILHTTLDASSAPITAGAAYSPLLTGPIPDAFSGSDHTFTASALVVGY